LTTHPITKGGGWVQRSPISDSPVDRLVNLFTPLVVVGMHRSSLLRQPRGVELGLWFVLDDGTRESLNEAEVDALCDALWSSGEKGAVNIVGKISHERQRAPVLQERVRISEGESHAFRSALDHARHRLGLYQVSGE
jgi:hypothetical protein